MRAEPKVEPEECLKAYLLKIYTRTVNLYEAEKYLNTFKIQKPKRTCSNFIDEFIIHYENYSHMKWSKEARTTSKEVIEKEKLSLITDGMCKDFKIYCDNIQFNLKETSLKDLEDIVATWQKDTTTGKAFTAACNPAKPNTSIASASAMELDEYFTTARDFSNHEAQTGATQSSATTTRGQRGGRGARGIIRGARGRGANTPRAPQISRDVLDGNHPNCRQTQDG